MSQRGRIRGNRSPEAAFLGWTFDAFDFFILTFVVSQVARDFGKPIQSIAFTLTASLLMRPVGALLFGLMADRWGRRIPLMLNIVFYSVMEVLSGFAPSYKIFLTLRLLYGIGMGGTWGVGASLAMESAPAKSRGILSGILQERLRTRLLTLAAIIPSGPFSHAGAGARCSSSPWRRLC